MSTTAESSLELAETNPPPLPNPRPPKTHPLPNPRPNPPPRRFRLPALEPSPPVLPTPSPLPPPSALPKASALPPFAEIGQDPLPTKVDGTQPLALPPPAHIIPPGTAGGGATFIPLSSLPQFPVPALLGGEKAGGDTNGGGREGPDVEVDEDIFNFRPQLDFEEFIKEHDGTRSNKYIRLMNNYAYTCCKTCCYNYLVIIIGIPATLVWAFILGSISFIANWIYIPILKVVTWFLNITFPVCRPVMECMAAIGPVVQAAASAASAVAKR